jgi:DNA-directed RNA polymerase specialized sigma24 family protein
VQIWLWKLAYPVIVREAAASLKERQLEPERPTAAPLTNSRRADLAGALLMLPIEERTTLVLTFHMRCSREEIANITQSSADVVSRRMQQALRVLRAKGWPWSAQPN